MLINVKTWGPEYASSLESFLRDRLSARSVTAVPEVVGTMAGSGCALINVLLHADTSAVFCALLAAGEGSRLWGVSLSVGMVKGLLSVMGRSLIEQSYIQCLFLSSQCPENFCIVSGTDNLFEPEHARLRISNSAKTLFAESPHRGIHTFSIPIRVRKNGEFLRETFEAVSQLGIMFADSEGAAVCFVEKPTYEQISENVSRFDTDYVYCNAFIFAFSRNCAETMRALYSAPTSSGAPLYSCTEFDWSAHVLTPVALLHGQGYEKGIASWFSPNIRNSASKKYFASDSDWALIWECAVSLHRQFGPVIVLDAGEQSLWYDCGLVSDMVALHLRAFSDERLSQKIFTPTLLRGNLFAHSDPPLEMPLSRECVFSDCRVSGAVKNAVRCVFAGTTVSECDLGGVQNCLFYRVDPASVARETLASDTCYFSFRDMRGNVHVGRFDAAANPKRGDLLGKPIDGIGRSFREIQSSRDIKLPF